MKKSITAFLLTIQPIFWTSIAFITIGHVQSIGVFVISLMVASMYIANFLSIHSMLREEWIDNYESPPHFDYLKTTEFNHNSIIAVIGRMKPKGQFVYLIKDIDVTGYHKIGMTTNPHTQLRDFGVKLPFNIHIVALIPCTNARQLESWLHKQYEGKRINGEWFNLNSNDIEQIKSMNGD